MGAAYSSLDGRGRALAVNVAASAGSCADSAPFLMSALTDGDEVVRGKALAKLHQPGCGREALPALTAALEDARTRTAVAPLVALFGRERALVPLANGLGLGLSRDRYVLRAAVAFAARGAVPEELGRLLEGAVKRSPEAGLDALRSLSERISDVPREANAAVGELLAKSPPLRTRYLLVDVLVALAHGPDASAKTALAELLLRDPSPEVRAHAMLSLASTSQPEASARAGLSDPAPRVREAALLAMAAAKVSATNGSMEHMLESDPWTFVRVAAALALAALPGTPESDRALGDAVKQVEKVESSMGVPDTVQGSFQGTAQAFQSSLRTEPYLIAAALVAVYIILGVLYESYILPLTILSTLPSAGVGALLMLLLFGYQLTVIALIGIILLIGIVKKNGIMMVDFAISAERRDGLWLRLVGDRDHRHDPADRHREEEWHHDG